MNTHIFYPVDRSRSVGHSKMVKDGDRKVWIDHSRVCLHKRIGLGPKIAIGLRLRDKVLRLIFLLRVFFDAKSSYMQSPTSC